MTLNDAQKYLEHYLKADALCGNTVSKLNQSIRTILDDLKVQTQSAARLEKLERVITDMDEMLIWSGPCGIGMDTINPREPVIGKTLAEAIDAITEGK